MADFVINEWLWADSWGDNGPNAQRQALVLITMLASSDHRIVVIVESPFDHKAWACCKSTNAAVMRVARTYITTIRQNSDRCLLLRPESAANLPDHLAKSIKPDDHYLVRAQLTVTGSVLVTTDAPLQAVVLNANLPCLSREEFLSPYV